MQTHYHASALKIYGDISHLYSASNLGWQGPSAWDSICDLTVPELDQACEEWQQEQQNKRKKKTISEDNDGIIDLTEQPNSEFMKPTSWNALKESNRNKLETAIMKLKVGLDISENRIVNRRILSEFINVCLFYYYSNNNLSI